MIIKNIKRLYQYLMVVLLCFLPTAVLLAQTVGTVQATQSARLRNPLSVDTLEALLQALLGIFIVLATPIIVFFIIYAGFLYVTARGNATQVQEATRALTYAIIGGVLVLGAFAITTMIGNLVASFR
jgi:hypothetical protein